MWRSYRGLGSLGILFPNGGCGPRKGARGLPNDGLGPCCGLCGAGAGTMSSSTCSTMMT